MLENERIVPCLLSAPIKSRCVFLTASGTGAMETVVMSLLALAERVPWSMAVALGSGSSTLCQLHGHNVDEIKLEFGRQISREVSRMW